MGLLDPLDDTLAGPQASVEADGLTVLPGGEVERKPSLSTVGGGKLEILNLPRLGIPAVMHGHIFEKHGDCKLSTMEHGAQAAYHFKLKKGKPHHVARHTAEFGAFKSPEVAKHLIERAIHARWDHGIKPWFFDVETVSNATNAGVALERLVSEINSHPRNYEGGVFFRCNPLYLEYHFVCSEHAGFVLPYSELEAARGASREPARQDSFVIRLVMERIHRDQIRKRIASGDLSPDFILPDGHNYALFVKAAYPIRPRNLDLRRVGN